MGRFTDKILGTPEQREHNATFNKRDTDPDSPALASHDRVVAAEKADKGRGKKS